MVCARATEADAFAPTVYLLAATAGNARLGTNRPRVPRMLAVAAWCDGTRENPKAGA